MKRKGKSSLDMEKSSSPGDLRALSVQCSPGAGTPETVADMIAALRFTVSLPAVQDVPTRRQFGSEMITVAGRSADSIGKSPETAALNELVLNGDHLAAYLQNLGIEHQYAGRHVSYMFKMLRYAHQLGWTCESYERQLECDKAWEPVLVALRGDTEGCCTIVKEAKKQQKVPSLIGEKFLADWRKSNPGRTSQSTQEVEGRFRSKMRQAGLESLFPLLDLSKRLPGQIAVDPASMSATVLSEIDRAVHLKTGEIVRGRPGKERVKPNTGKQIRCILMELCGHAMVVLGLTIISLADFFTVEVITNFIDTLRCERGVLASGIRTRLGNIRYLIKTDLLPRGDYLWFGRELRKLRNEPRWRLDERQRARCVAYEELAKVPERIRAQRMDAKNLSPVDVAWLVHDELFSSWPLHLPWRFCSIADCGLFAPAFTNIIDHELTDAMRADPDLPEWVKKALKHNKHQRFLQFSFGRSQCKNNHAFRDVFPRELSDLYLEYTTNHRKLIVDENHDDGTLFLNRRGRRLGSQTCRDLYQRLVQRWIGRAARPHLTRDSFCEYYLAHGGTMRQLKRILGHRFMISTERYCRRYDTSHGAVALQGDIERNRKAA